MASPEGVRVRTMVMVPLLPVGRTSRTDLVDNDPIRSIGEEHSPVAEPKAAPVVAALEGIDVVGESGRIVRELTELAADQILGIPRHPTQGASGSTGENQAPSHRGPPPESTDASDRLA